MPGPARKLAAATLTRSRMPGVGVRVIVGVAMGGRVFVGWGVPVAGGVAVVVGGGALAVLSGVEGVAGAQPPSAARSASSAAARARRGRPASFSGKRSTPIKGAMVPFCQPGKRGDYRWGMRGASNVWGGRGVGRKKGAFSGRRIRSA